MLLSYLKVNNLSKKKLLFFKNSQNLDKNIIKRDKLKKEGLVLEGDTRTNYLNISTKILINLFYSILFFNSTKCILYLSFYIKV